MMPSMSSAAQFDAGEIGKQLSSEEREWPESERAGFDFLETESSHQAIECIHGIAVLGRATLVNPARFRLPSLICRQFFGLRNMNCAWHRECEEVQVRSGKERHA